MKKTEKGIRLVLVLSDLHVGSTKALLPPDFKTLEGNEVKLNAMQEWLWECWVRANAFIEEVADGDPYALVLNGDLIEGIHHGTKEIWSPEVKDHIAAAYQLLAPVAKRAAHTFLVRGTECHTNNQEVSLGEMLGAERCKETGLAATDRLTLDVNGVRHVFRHHIGSTIRRGLAGTQLSINLAEEQVEAVNNGESLPRVVCMAHRHKFGIYQDDNGMAIVSPPWQGLTRFGHKVVSQARTKPGLFILDSRGQQHGQLPKVWNKTYECPAPSARTIG
jgi:hypothetical protein